MCLCLSRHNWLTFNSQCRIMRRGPTAMALITYTFGPFVDGITLYKQLDMRKFRALTSCLVAASHRWGRASFHFSVYGICCGISGTRDFRLPPRCKWDLQSYGILHGADWYIYDAWSPRRAKIYGKVTLGLLFSKYVGVPIIIIPPVLHTHFSFSYIRLHIILAIYSAVK